MEDNKKWINDIKVTLLTNRKTQLLHYIIKDSFTTFRKKIKQCLFILFKILIFFNHLHVS